jgi:hypothetical protein
MSTVVIFIIVLAVLVLVGLAVTMVRRRAVEREIEADRISGEAFAHRDQAESNVARARDLGQEAEEERKRAEQHAIAADEHAQAAQEHAERATSLEQKVETAGRAAAFHDDQAAEREERLA